MTSLCKSICSWLLCMICQITYGQQLNFKHIGIEDGLSNSTIECIFQDHRGFIWFGTRDGLNRYDGTQIISYKHTSDSSSISDNYIRCIFESKDKKLWIGTSNGLNRFNAELNSFQRFKASKSISALSNNTVTSIAENERGLWISTYSGLNRLDQTTGKFETYRNDQINDLHTDNKGIIWLATEKGLVNFNSINGAFKSMSSLEKYVLRTITTAPDGNLWLATEDQGLVFFNTQNYGIKTFKHQHLQINSLASDLVRAIVYGRDNHIWIGAVNGGLDKFNPQTNTFVNYQNEPGNLSSLSQRTVSALYEDNQGNLWVGTHRGGVNLYSPQSNKFKLVQQEANKNSLSYNDVRAFNEDSKGNLWIGTDGGGLNYYDRKKNTFTHYKYSPFNESSIGSNAVLDIMPNTDSQLFIGTWGGGLNLMDARNGSFRRFLHNPNIPGSISSNYVQKSFEDSKGNLWIGTYYGGLNLFNKKTQKFQRIIYGNGKSKLSGNNVIAINEDKVGNLWIATDDGGLNCYNLTSKIFTPYFHNEQKKPDLRVLFVDRKGRLWVGQTGLYLYNPTAKTFSLYTRKAGLDADFIKGITEDESGNFWISTTRGLTRFHPENLSFKNFNTADGLQGMEFEANAFLKARNGEMFFGGINGFNSFFPNEIRTNKFVPPVYLTGFQIFNNLIVPGKKGSPLEKDISFTQKIKLRSDQSTFSFSFAGLNYVASENNNYAYKLDGFDQDWNYAGKSQKAYYTNVYPGRYTLLVKSSNNDNVWNNHGASIEIVVMPPFYSTWWFRVLVASVVIYLAYVLLSLRRRLEIKAIEEQKREEMHQVQLQFFTNISHEFRTPLSLILGPIERLLKEDSKIAFQNYYRTIHRNANRLLSLINELMDFRKIETGAFKLKIIQGNLSIFIDEIAEEFTEMAMDKNISFNVNKTGEFNEIWFDRHVIEKIILNLINNSLKYTPSGGIVTLEIWDTMNDFKPEFVNQLIIPNDYQAKNYIYIRVADTGIGVSKASIHHLFERYYRITDAHLGSGVGLAFVKSLTTLHKGKIYVSSEKNSGTEIIIGLPCSKGDYSDAELWGKSEEAGGTSLESVVYRAEQNLNKEIVAPVISSLNKHILVVDDNEELRNFLKEILQHEYHISEAADGYDGLKKAKEENPDLIISDVMMPHMDGREFCKLLKEDIEINHIPFVMLTAKNSTEAEIEGVESGADLYFSKPVNISLLQSTLRNIFDQRQKLKNHYSKNHQVTLRELVHNTRDRDFMEKLLSIINDQLTNPDLDIEFLCAEMGMSRTKLYQKISSITGQSIGEFIRSIRLRKAAEIMTQEDVLLTEVMYRIGIQTQSYFTKAFKKEFGKTPSRFLQEISRRNVEQES